jgi:hypothetical protein
MLIAARSSYDFAPAAYARPPAYARIRFRFSRIRFGRHERDLARSLLPAFTWPSWFWRNTREMMPDKSDDFFIKPKDVAESAFWLSSQARSAWSFAIKARPFGEPRKDLNVPTISRNEGYALT